MKKREHLIMPFLKKKKKKIHFFENIIRYLLRNPTIKWKNILHDTITCSEITYTLNRDLYSKRNLINSSFKLRHKAKK